MERLDESNTSPSGQEHHLLVPKNRILYINGNNDFVKNQISTCKYPGVSMLWRFPHEQYKKYSNWFFTIIALLQQIPNLSPTGRYTTLVPLLFIFAVSFIKEYFEDRKRKRADQKVNNTLVLVLNKFSSQWDWKCWKEVSVGDIIKVTNDQFFPSDLFIISSSEPNGMCYIETANLDGETNLKIRQSLPDTASCLTCDQIIRELSLASIECDQPNSQLYEFRGNLKLSDKLHPIGPENILLRGAKLRNTNWIFGCVLYTGKETKLMMNSTKKPPLKQSNLERETNKQIVNMFLILVFISLVSAIAYHVWLGNNYDAWYLAGLTANNISMPSSLAWLETIFHSFGWLLKPFGVFITFFILYNNLIPISLQVTLEIVRYCQAHFINSDLEMYHEETDTPALARTSNLNEELGQVGYILSDKTGTLTRNEMEFKKCTIAGTIYDENDFESLVQIIDTNQPQADIIREFLTLLAVCHTVVPETCGTKEYDKNGKQIVKYQASSPDEAALVRGVQKIGFDFTTRTPQYVFINALGNEERYEILNVLEFNSDRKRMSVIVRAPNGKIKLYIKGADSMIIERVKDSQFVNETEEHLTEFAKIGLRTLCCAMVLIDEQSYQKWNKKYTKTLIDQKNLTGKKREESLNNIMNEIEQNLSLLGATAIEDKLQEQVPETIETLLKAGIKIWVLTGDKQETAINIGNSCRLLQQNQKIIIINEDSFDATRESLNDAESQADSKCGLIIDGFSLKYVLTEELKAQFMDVALKCKSVICCRVSPAQKAQVVEAIKHSTGEITLAIGDGANDVAMIRAAHVGVGISGHEGLQAVHSADYAISQFKFLRRLLLVHGSWSLARLSKLILYSFYKNICLYVIEFWFAMVSAWSGQTIFERWTIGMYNVLFTVAPPLAIGLFDKPCSSEVAMKNPILYRSHSKVFTFKLFLMWVFCAILHSLLLFWLTYFAVRNDALWQHGKSDGGYLVFGNMLYTYVVVTVCLKAGLEMNSWTYLSQISIWGSIIAWFLFLLIYSKTWPFFTWTADMSGIDCLVYTTYVFWFGLIIIPMTSLLFDFTYKVLTRTMFKTFADELIELEAAAQRTPTRSFLNDTRNFIRSFFPKTTKIKRITTLRSHYNDIEPGASGSRRSRRDDIELEHGYAFSQEENGAVAQSELIRVYDTTKMKPSGD